MERLCVERLCGKPYPSPLHMPYLHRKPLEVESGPPMPIQTISAEQVIEAICACHLASYVQAPVSDRGGLMLVGPPGALKTTFLEVLESYHNTMTMSSINTQTLMRAQQDLYSGAIRSLIIPDMHALYAGDPRTAARVESTLMQLAGEGTRGASWQDTRHQHFIARATIFSAMTPTHFERHSKEWEESGFLRRFLWCRYTLADPDVLMRALERWTRAELGLVTAPVLPASNVIPDSLTNADRASIRTWLKYQPRPHEIQYALLCRATAALKWCYHSSKIKRNALETMRAFSKTLQRDAAIVALNNKH